MQWISWPATPRTTHHAPRTPMADRVLITTDDLEQAVRVNASLEQAGLDTAMVSSLDDVRQSVRGRQPDAIILTGGLHESTAQRLLAAAREHAVSTLGLVESTDEDPSQIGRELGLTGWLVKPPGPNEVPATARRVHEGPPRPRGGGGGAACRARKGDPPPAPPGGGWDPSSWPTRARSSSTKSANARPPRRSSCCGCSRTGASSASAARSRSRSTCV